MKGAIIGAGAMGTIVGALISKSGQKIDLIDSNEEQVRALNKSGARVVGTLQFSARVQALTPAQITAPYDFFLYMVKSTMDTEALDFVKSSLKPDGFVVTLQNGIPEEKVASAVGIKRTLGGVVGWGANMAAPGLSMLNSEPDKMSYDIGELDGTTTTRLNRIINLLKPAGQPAVTDNLFGVRWAKLVVNATFSAVAAVSGGTYGNILGNSKALTAAAHLGREAISVVRAARIVPEPIQGFDIGMLDFNSADEMKAILPIYGAAFGPHKATKGSLLNDLEAGRPTEVDAINGVISHWGRRLQVDTPVNDQVVKIIKAIEAGDLNPGTKNLDMINLPK